MNCSLIAAATEETGPIAAGRPFFWRGEIAMVRLEDTVLVALVRIGDGDPLASSNCKGYIK